MQSGAEGTILSDPLHQSHNLDPTSKLPYLRLDIPCWLLVITFFKIAKLHDFPTSFIWLKWTEVRTFDFVNYARSYTTQDQV